MSSRTGIAALIDHAKTRVPSNPGLRTAEIIRQYAEAFDASCARQALAQLNLFAFHVDVPASHRTIEYVDVKHDHWSFDYRRLSSHFIWAGSAFNQAVHIYFVTNSSCEAPTPRNNLTVVRLQTDDKAPMLERVKAMAGYVNSSAFNCHTVFLDTDAYPNRALVHTFAKDFDVGVTYRTTPGYMPLNEGVIFGSHRNRAAVQRFFAAYLATYENLICDPVVTGYYGDIERWRGGQLSLNAVACPRSRLVETDSFESNGVKIGLFPCNTFNYWVTKSLRPGASHWDRKFVLHLKGDSKSLLEHVIAYQQSRACEGPAGPAAPKTRRNPVRTGA